MSQKGYHRRGIEMVLRNVREDHDPAITHNAEKAKRALRRHAVRDRNDLARFMDDMEEEI